MTARAKLEESVMRSHTWQSGRYPDLHAEEVAGRAAFLRAVRHTFYPWPHDPAKALATLDALEAT